MKQTPARRGTHRVSEEEAESNGLLLLLFSGALFILSLLPVVV